MTSVVAELHPRREAHAVAKRRQVAFQVPTRAQGAVGLVVAGDVVHPIMPRVVRPQEVADPLRIDEVAGALEGREIVDGGQHFRRGSGLFVVTDGRDAQAAVVVRERVAGDDIGAENLAPDALSPAVAPLVDVPISVHQRVVPDIAPAQRPGVIRVDGSDFGSTVRVGIRGRGVMDHNLLGRHIHLGP